MITSHTFAQDAATDENIFKLSDVEVKPEFKGGVADFYKFIAKNFKMPDEEGLNGKIIVEFVIEKDGSISNINVIQDIGYGTDKETVRVFENSPKWIPGKKNGEVVRTLYTIPITIKSS